MKVVKKVVKEGDVTVHETDTLDLEELKQIIGELLSEYEIEITVDIRTGRGVGRWKKKQ
jgi:hypothetical protein